MNNNGWIKISRRLKDHWLWQDANKLKWWLDLLMSVNHKSTKVLLGNKLVVCERGQSIQSLTSWAMQWKVSKTAVKNFFTLLEKEGMITHENLGKTTRITICNYASYQDEENDKNPIEERCENARRTQEERCENARRTQEERCENARRTQEETNKNEKNEKNILKNRVLTNSIKGEGEEKNDFLEEKNFEKKSNFIKPTKEEVQAYITERECPFTADEFFDYYESVGWKIGNKTMKDWKACVRTWEAKRHKEDAQKPASAKKQININEVNALWN
jgi:hypothetical protein